jgi:predicted nucleic acid-binding protein
LAKRLAEEAHTEAFNAWLDGFLAAGGRVLAPHILRYELGNLLAKKARTEPALTPGHRENLLREALVGVQFADGVGIEESAPPLSFYDAAYLALARSLKSALVTYDSRLLAAARKARLKTISPGA